MELERRFKRLEEQVAGLSSKLMATERWQKAIEPWLFSTFQLDIRELINTNHESELCQVDNTQTELSDNIYFTTRRSEVERKRRGSQWNDAEDCQDVIELRAEDICIPTFSVPDFEQENSRTDILPSRKKRRRNARTIDLACSTPPKITTGHVMSFFCSPFSFTAGSETVSVEIPNTNCLRRIGYKDLTDVEIARQEQKDSESLKLNRKEDLTKQESSELSDTVGEPYYYNDDEGEDYIEEIVESASTSECTAEEKVLLPLLGPPQTNLKDWEMKCIICLKYFSSSIRLINHESKIHGVKKGHALKCMFQPNCRLIFRGVRQLTVHMRCKHKDDYERILKQNMNPIPSFNIERLMTPASASTLELLREADNEAFGRRVSIPRDWHTTNYFSENWLQLMERYQNGIMPYSAISKREDLKQWFEYLPNDKEPQKARYRCRLCYNYAHYLQLPINSVYLLAKAEGQLRENDCLNQRCINHHNKNSLTHKSIIRLLKEVCQENDE